jgi:hypothetical protein
MEHEAFHVQPGGVNPGALGHCPSLAGSPPILTHCECDGVGPSNTYIMCQPGGEMNAFGGAVTVQLVETQENAGKMVRPPIKFP